MKSNRDAMKELLTELFKFDTTGGFYMVKDTSVSGKKMRAIFDTILLEEVSNG